MMEMHVVSIALQSAGHEWHGPEQVFKGYGGAGFPSFRGADLSRASGFSSFNEVPVNRLQYSCAGKNVADAQHAAIAIEHAGEWITRDRDFNRFVPHGLKLQILEP